MYRLGQPMQKSIVQWRMFAGLAGAVLVVLPPAEAQTQLSYRAAAHGIWVAAWRPDTAVVILREKKTHVVTITSPFGIDHAVLRRTADKWPARISIRMHLSGLESFKASTGAVELGWSVANAKDRRTSMSLRSGQGTGTGTRVTVLAKDSPYWTAVSVGIADKNKAAAAGYLEVSLPRKLFESNPREINLQWVDFYR